jgi:uroporphyrinogen-III synthase
VPHSPCILLTRELQDNAALAQGLRDNGVKVREIPCMETHAIRPTRTPPATAAVAFGSRRSVAGYLAAGFPLPAIVAAVGTATADALRQAGIETHILCKPATSTALALALARVLPTGATVLVPRGSLQGGLQSALIKQGLTPIEVVVYENREPTMPLFDPFPVAAIFVAAPSAGERLLRHYPWLRDRPFLAIGATTQSALKELAVTTILGTAQTLETQITMLTAAWHSELQP